MATTFEVQKMNCNGCARDVTQAIHSVAPQAEVKVDLAAARVEVNPPLPNPALVAEAIAAAGYPARAVA